MIDWQIHNSITLVVSREDTDEIMWLERESPAHKILCDYVRSPNFLGQLKQTAHGQHTGMLEVLHSLLLTYVSKRINYDPSAYNGRIQLAILDHNENVNREPKKGIFILIIQTYQ